MSQTDQRTTAGHRPPNSSGTVHLKVKPPHPQPVQRRPNWGPRATHCRETSHPGAAPPTQISLPGTNGQGSGNAHPVYRLTRPSRAQPRAHTVPPDSPSLSVPKGSERAPPADSQPLGSVPQRCRPPRPGTSRPGRERHKLLRGPSPVLSRGTRGTEAALPKAPHRLVTERRRSEAAGAPVETARHLLAQRRPLAPVPALTADRAAT